MIRRIFVGGVGLVLLTILCACGGDTRQPKIDAAKSGGGMDISKLKEAKPKAGVLEERR